MFALASRFLKQGSDPSQGQQHFMLFARLESASLHEDKFAAVNDLNTLIHDNPALALNSRQLNTLLEAAEEHGELTQLVLHAIYTLFLHQSPSNSITLLSLFTKREHVSFLLALLPASACMVRYYSVRILTCLLSDKTEKVQPFILAEPRVIQTILDMLTDSNELIRNASLPFIEALITNSPEIQKTLAFNGVFDMLHGVVITEGGLIEGGVIGEDAIRIVASLVRSNASTQQLFAELGSVPALASLLRQAADALASNQPVQLSNAAHHSLAFALDIVYFVSIARQSVSSLASLLQPCSCSARLLIRRAT